MAISKQTSHLLIRFGHLVHSRPLPAAVHLDRARKILVFRYTNFLSTLFYHPCHSLFFNRDHLRCNMGFISGPGSFAVQFGDHLRSGIICGPGNICGPVQLHTCSYFIPCHRKYSSQIGRLGVMQVNCTDRWEGFVEY